VERDSVLGDVGKQIALRHCCTLCFSTWPCALHFELLYLPLALCFCCASSCLLSSACLCVSALGSSQLCLAQMTHLG
jgi:hypothetical protein